MMGIHSGLRRAARGTWLAFLLGALPLASANAQSAAVALLRPIQNIALLEPQVMSVPGGSALYGWTGPAPDWRIAQWNIPGTKLSPFTSVAPGGPFDHVSTSPEATVQTSGTQEVDEVDLSQNGTILPCDKPGGAPRESDLFLSPNGFQTAAPGVSGLTEAALERPRLASLHSLVFTADLRISEGLLLVSKGCAVNQGGALLGVVLSEENGSVRQTLFYQLQFDRICGPGSAARQKLCHSVPKTSQFFSKTSPFGTGDIGPQVGLPLLHGTAALNIKLDILGRLEQILASGPPALDHDPSHWFVSNIYVGQHIWGDVTMRSSWRNIQLLATPN